MKNRKIMVLILASSMVVQQSNAIGLPSLDTLPKKVGFGLVVTGATLFLAYQGYRFFREMYYIESLHCACRDDDEETVKRLRPKLTPHIVNFVLDDATPLGIACRNDNFEIAKELMPHTSQNMINYFSFFCTNPDGGGDGGRPLHFACRNNNISLVKLLIENGSYIDEEDFDLAKETADRKEILDYLEEAIRENKTKFLKYERVFQIEKMDIIKGK